MAVGSRVWELRFRVLGVGYRVKGFAGFQGLSWCLGFEGGPFNVRLRTLQGVLYRVQTDKQANRQTD